MGTTHGCVRSTGHFRDWAWPSFLPILSAMGTPLHVLFVCSRNQWRSPTAARAYRNDPRIAVRAAGLSDASRRRIRAGDLAWADLVLVMEAEHRKRIARRFGRDQEGPPIRSLDVPDEYGYMDPELVRMLRGAIEPLLIEALDARGA